MKDCPASAGSCWCSRVACCCSRSPQIQSWVLGNSIENLPDMELWPPSLSPLIVPGCIRGFTHRLDVKNREVIPRPWWHSAFETEHCVTLKYDSTLYLWIVILLSFVSVYNILKIFFNQNVIIWKVHCSVFGGQTCAWNSDQQQKYKFNLIGEQASYKTL